MSISLKSISVYYCHKYSSLMSAVLSTVTCIAWPGQVNSKPVLSDHSKIDKTKVLKTHCSLIQVESIAECPLGAFCNTFDLHKAVVRLEKQFWSFLSCHFRQVLLCIHVIRRTRFLPRSECVSQHTIIILEMFWAYGVRIEKDYY